MATNSFDKIVRIGGASGFTGDSTVSVPQLLTMPGLNYIVFDYLAELALGRLAKQGRADDNSGYWQDFVVTHMAPYLEAIMAHEVKIISKTMRADSNPARLRAGHLRGGGEAGVVAARRDRRG